MSYKNCRLEIMNCFRTRLSSTEMMYAIVPIADLLLEAKKNSSGKEDTVEDILSNSMDMDEREKYLIRNIAKKYITMDIWDSLKEITKKYSEKDFEELILSTDVDAYERSGKEGNYTSPQSLVDLTEALLEIKNSDNVAVLCCGNGDSIVNMAESVPGADYYGVDINSEAVTCAMIKARITKAHVEIEQKDVFTIEENKKFNSVFCDSLIAQRIATMGAGKEYFDQKSYEMQALSHVRVADWLYGTKCFDLLSKDGKAAVIMTSGLWNSEDQLIRELYVTNGYVNAVITLPNALFAGQMVKSNIVILSKSDNKRHGVYMVDASDCCIKGRRINTFSEENIADIVEACKSDDSKLGRFVSQRELSENSFSLVPSRYLTETIEIENGRPFSSVIKNITRGAHIAAAELDKMTSYEQTDYHYLMLSNIQNGIVDESLPYLKEIRESDEKYCITDGNLLISKNGEPYKIAVASNMEGKKVLANGNLYVIEVDCSQVNPYYLQAYFESDQGRAQLHSITVGTTMRCIGVNDLKSLIIPLPELEVQNRIADDYKSIQEEVKYLNVRLQRAVDNLHHVMER